MPSALYGAYGRDGAEVLCLTRTSIFVDAECIVRITFGAACCMAYILQLQNEQQQHRLPKDLLANGRGTKGMRRSKN